MNQEKEIGEIFRESFSGYTQEPPAGLWDAIAHDKTLLRFNRRKWWLRAAKISAIAYAPFVAVIVITTLFFPKAPKDNTSTVTPDQVATTSSVTVPSPAPLVAESSTPATPSQTPQPSPTQAPIVTTQNTDNQQEATEEISVPEPVTTAAATTSEEVSTASATPKQKESPIIKEENEKVLNNPIVPSDIQLEPKSGRSGQIVYSKDTSVCRNSKLTLFVHNAMEVRWNIGVQGEAVTLYPEEPMLIAATITTFDKIDTTIYIQVGIFDCGLWIPTAFTPNGDGLNDEFIVHAPADITHYECAIYDRQKGLQFRTNNILQGWDGTSNGKPLPLGAYFYIITYRDGAGVKHVEKGQITLIR